MWGRMKTAILEKYFVKMVVWDIVVLISFQIFLADSRGITTPITTVADKAELFDAPLTNARENILEDILIASYNAAYNKQDDDVSSVDIQTIPMIMIPGFDSCFQAVLSYAKECALKYGCYNQIQALISDESITDSSLPSIKPVRSVSNTIVNESSSILLTPSSSRLSSLKTPDTVNSFDPFCVKLHNPFDIANEPLRSIDIPCFDLSNSLPETKLNSGTEPLSLCRTVAPSVLSKSAINLTESSVLSKSPFISKTSPLPCSPVSPVSSLSTVNSSYITNSMITSLETPRSAFTLPLTLTSTTTTLYPVEFHGCLPSASNTQLYPAKSLCLSSTHSQLNDNEDELCAPSSKIELNSKISSTTQDYNKTLSSPRVAQMPAITSLSGFNQDRCASPANVEYANSIGYPIATNPLPLKTLQHANIGVSNKTFTSLDTKRTSSNRSCTSLKPLETSFVDMLSSHLSPHAASKELYHSSNPTFENSTFQAPFESISQSYTKSPAPVLNNINTSTTSSSKPSLTSPILPCDSNPSLPMSLSLLVSSCLPLSPNLASSAISDSCLLSNEIPHSSILETKSFKRSTNVDKLPESGIFSALQFDSINTNKNVEKQQSRENADKLQARNKYIKRLQKLLSLIEMLSDEDTAI